MRNQEVVQMGELIDGCMVLDSILMPQRYQLDNRRTSGILRNTVAVVNNQEEDPKEQIETSSECSICLRGLYTSDTIFRMPQTCSHVFHRHCILTWLQIKNTCPLCRRTIHL